MEEEPMETWAVTIKDRLKLEAIKGGELKGCPCPFCGRPRSQRSDYIRCTPCATNWSPGEDLDKDPRLTRKVDGKLTHKPSGIVRA